MLTTMLEKFNDAFEYMKHGSVVKMTVCANEVSELTLSMAKSLDADLIAGETIQLDAQEPIQLVDGMFAITTEYSGNWFTKPKMTTDIFNYSK